MKTADDYINEKDWKRLALLMAQELKDRKITEGKKKDDEYACYVKDCHTRARKPI